MAVRMSNIVLAEMWLIKS